MVWGCISSNGIGKKVIIKCNMNVKQYEETVKTIYLRADLCNSVLKLEFPNP